MTQHEPPWSVLLLVGVLCLVLGYYGAGLKDWPLCSAEQVQLGRGR
jgi:hypothetical protein